MTRRREDLKKGVLRTHDPLTLTSSMENLHDNPNGERCRPDWVVDFLGGALSSDHEIIFESHLSRCQKCRNVLERQAAEESFWQETKSALIQPSDKAMPQERVLRLADTLRLAFLNSVKCDSSFSENEDSEEVWKSWLGTPTIPDSIGRVLKYEILSAIGKGGMGIVFRAVDTELNRIVALKTLSAQSRFQGEARMRLLREARATALLSHPNIIPIYALENWDGIPFIVSPYIPGGNLHDYVVNHDLPIEESINMVIQIADALAVLHDCGVVHRDLKPSNILVNQETKQLILCDFGLARIESDNQITHEHAIAGTPFFMSPEQAEGLELDSRSDLFSLGSLAYWLLSRKYPFVDRTKLGILRRIVDESPLPLSRHSSEIPRSVQQAVHALLIKERAKRLGPASKVAERFRQCLAEMAADTSQRSKMAASRSGSDDNALISQVNKGERAKRRNRTGVVLVIVLTSVLTSICLMFLWSITSGRTEVGVDKSVASLMTRDGNFTSSDGMRSEATTLADSSPEKAASLIQEMEEPIPFVDIGLPLTIAERTAILADLRQGLRQKRWLTRLSKMSSQLIPADILTLVIPLGECEDPELRSLAEAILSKSPFEEGFIASDSKSAISNPDRPSKAHNVITPVSALDELTDPFHEPPNPFQEVPYDTIPKK